MEVSKEKFAWRKMGQRINEKERAGHKHQGRIWEGLTSLKR
jgi:hypothetical protein